MRQDVCGLKSDLKEGPENDYPVKDGTAPAPQQYGSYAICIDAAEGRLALHGKEELTAATSGPKAPNVYQNSYAWKSY